MRLRILRAAALLAALALSACGGGGGGGGSEPPSTPIPESARPNLQGADTLRASRVYSRWSLSNGQMAINDTAVETITCTGARCTWEDGTVTQASSLLGSGMQSGNVHYAMRSGFDTSRVQSAFDFTEQVTGVQVTARPQATSWGLWGDYGFAALMLSNGPLTAQLGGDTFTGNFMAASAWALGEASGSNPAGTGRAVWQGIVEAASTRTFQRLQGTSTLTIPDLSRPRIGVEITVPGHSINAPGWASMALSNGGFSTGTAGTDHLSGNFYGPQHQEAWGVFDTGGYVGAFGAKRTP